MKLPLPAILVSALLLGACDPEPTPETAAPPHTSTSATPTDQSRELPAGPADPLPELQGVTRLAPRDDGTKDPSFAAFREGLLASVVSRDRKALEGALAPAIRYTFGDGAPTPEGFFAHWDQAGRDVWIELEEVLTMGGTFDAEGGVRRFVAPYVFGAWPDEIDPFTHVAAICERTVVHEEPRDDSPAMGRLDYQVVELVLDPQYIGPEAPWRMVRLSSGATGYVRADCVRSQIDYRAGFEKLGEDWKMVFFVAGD